MAQQFFNKFVGRVKTEGEGSERQDGRLRSSRGRVFESSDYEDWLVVSEMRTEEEKQEADTKKDKWPWYQGRMNRSVAEDNLSKSARFDGTFLVRESDALPVNQEPVYVISVLKDGVTHHVEVQKLPNGKYTMAFIEGAKTFKSLKKLVNYYTSKPMDLEGGGSTNLKYTVDS